MMFLQTSAEDFSSEFLGGSVTLPVAGGEIVVTGGTNVGGGQINTVTGKTTGTTNTVSTSIGGISLGMLLIIALAFVLILKM